MLREGVARIIAMERLGDHTQPVLLHNSVHVTDDQGLVWEWYNATTTQHQQLYVSDENIKLKCNY